MSPDCTPGLSVSVTNWFLSLAFLNQGHHPSPKYISSSYVSIDGGACGGDGTLLHSGPKAGISDSAMVPPPSPCLPCTWGPLPTPVSLPFTNSPGVLSHFSCLLIRTSPGDLSLWQSVTETSAMENKCKKRTISGFCEGLKQRTRTKNRGTSRNKKLVFIGEEDWGVEGMWRAPSTIRGELQTPQPGPHTCPRSVASCLTTSPHGTFPQKHHEQELPW